MKELIILFFIFSGFNAVSQNWNNYTPLKARGEVPAVITDAYESKYYKETENISDEDKRKDRKLKDEFYRKSEYFIDDYLVSGKILFGDSITNYCRMVLDKVIGDDEELKNKLTLFTVKSSSVNALATEKGIIFVNLGLLAQLETEAQLAFILAHELIHFTKNHTIDQYLVQDKIKNGKDLYRGTDQDEKITALSNYSKNTELEADELGYQEFFSKTNYSRNAANEVMDILQYSYLPFDEVVFDQDFFDDKNLKFGPEKFLEELNPITAEADYDDENSTHPNISKRKQAISFILDDQEGEDFLVSENAFKHIRKWARYELNRIYFTNQKYGQLIYNSYLLLKDDPDNFFLKLNISKALHNLQVYKNQNALENVLTEPDDIEGESHQLYYFLDNLSKEELSTLAVSYSYRLKKAYPADSIADLIWKRSIKEMVFTNELQTDDFKTISYAVEHSQEEFNLDSLNNIDNKQLSKVDKIKKKRSATAFTDDYYKYAFVDFLNDEEFRKRFNELSKELEEKDFSDDDNLVVRDKYDKNRTLGLDKIICVDPRYLKLDERDEDGIKFLSTHSQLEKYKTNIISLSERIGLDMIMLDFKSDKAFTVEKYNDLALLKAWIGERLNHENYNVLVSDFNYMEEVTDHYNTPYAMATGNLTLKIDENQVADVFTLFLSLALPVYTPFVLADLVSPEYISFNYCFVFDLRNGNILMAEYNEYESKDHQDYLKSIIYNNLLQIKDHPKN